MLPSGFAKVRHYGFLSAASGVSLDLVRWLIALWAGLTYVLRSVPDEGRGVEAGRADVRGVRRPAGAAGLRAGGGRRCLRHELGR